MRRASRLLLAAWLFVAAIAPPSIARADEPAGAPAKPSTLPERQANFAWVKVAAPGGAPVKTVLHASFSFRDAADAHILAKLSSGLPTVVAMRAYVIPQGQTEPVALAVRSCRVVYDLWDEVYRIKITSPVAGGTGSERDIAAVSTDGVLRQCFEARDLPIVDKALLKPVPHFLGVIVEVNPISPQMLEQMRRWVSRPTGSTGIGPSDALFGSFVGLFVRQIGTSDKTLKFRTEPVTP